MVSALRKGAPGSGADRTVTLVEPAAGTEFTALATIPFVVAVDPAEPPAVSIQLLAGEREVVSLTNVLSGSWSNVIAGTYQLAARAVFSDGSTVTSAPVSVTVTVPLEDLPPRFTAISPEDQSTWALPANLQLTAHVHDPSPQGRIIDFRVFVDGELLAARTNHSLFHVIPWNNVRRHQDAIITFQATDFLGAVTSTNITLRFVSPTYYGRYLTDRFGRALEALALADDDTVFGNLDGWPWQLGPDGILTLLSDETQAAEVTTAGPDGRAAGILYQTDPPFHITRLETVDPFNFLVSLTTPYYLGLDAVLQRSFDLRIWQDVSTNSVFETPASEADQQFFRTVPRVP